MKKISFRVIRTRTIYLALACVLVLASIALLVFRGFNLGIDFESGLSISVKVEDAGVQIADVRSAVSSIEGVRVQNVGSSDDGRYQIRVKLPDGTDQRSAEEHINSLLSVGCATYDFKAVIYIKNDLHPVSYKITVINYQNSYRIHYLPPEPALLSAGSY